MSEWERTLQFVQNLVRECAREACVGAASARATVKANQSYVTNLDHALERRIREALSAEFPDDLLTGEEYADSAGQSSRVWSIDPIDGTGNLVHSLPLWAISVGLIEEGEPVLGVIAIPPLGELYWATRGGGAFRDGERIAAAPDRDDFHTQDNVCIGTNLMRRLDLSRITGRLRDFGSSCCELAFTASGRLVASGFLGEQRHDLAAGAVIATEAGCRFGTLGGGPMSPGQLLAATPLREPTFCAPPRRLTWLLAHAAVRD